MKLFLYRFWQCTWGFLQTLLGLFVFCLNLKSPHESYHGAVITKWKLPSSVSLGLFVFVAADPPCYPAQGITQKEDSAKRLLVHEYGHTIQSLIFGPLYLIVMGIPSMLWGFLPWLRKKRRVQRLSYFSFYTERLANYFGEKVTGEPSMGDLVIE